MSISEVLKQSVSRLHDRLRQERATPFDTMQALGVIGAFDGGDPDASANVKQTVAQVLENKLGSR